LAPSLSVYLGVLRSFSLYRHSPWCPFLESLWPPTTRFGVSIFIYPPLLLFFTCQFGIQSELFPPRSLTAIK
jgi:hypothetical protein